MADAQTPGNNKTFLGHPLGLYTLFFTEMWERFSFYGMKALLLLYMVEYLVWDQQEASSVFKWYTSLVYFTPVFGGLIADYLLGARKSVAIGCVLITIGHLCLAFEPLPYFYAGLGFLILGVGFLKANISTQVGAMYHPGDPRRDAGFTIFYMGINLGAFLGPLVCGSLRFAYGWHYGFGAAGVGMFFGLIVYLLGQRWVIQVDQSVDAAGHELHTDESSGQDAGNPAGNAAKPAPHAQRDRVIALVICCLFAGIFFMCFEQAANVMMRWASDQTNLQVFHLEPTPASLEIDTAGADAAAGDSSPSDGGSWRDAEMPTSYTQSINPLFIILLGPLFGWLWIWLEKRRKQPSSPAKMALGLFLICMAFVVMMIASQAEDKESSAPLQAIPAEVKLADYGATRLRFDETTHTLQMNGVLPKLDRIRLLGESAAQGYHEVAERLIEEAREKAEQASDQEEWEVRASLPDDVPAPSVIALLPDSVRWDEQTRSLVASASIPDRDRLRLLAAGADAAFREAIDSIYVQSSMYRLVVWWLVLHFLIATMGELCLSPVGLSLVTKLAPPKNVGLCMGLWFITTGSLANYLAHQFGGGWGSMTPFDYFIFFAVVGVVASVLMVIMLRFLKNRMHGVR